DTSGSGSGGPRPIGRAMPPSPPGGGVAVRYSPAVPGGGNGGGTWSNELPLSSHVMNRTVLAQSSGCDVMAATTWLTPYSPHAKGTGGCSVQRNWRLIHDTAGRFPLAQSAAKSLGDVCEPKALAASAGSERNCLKRKR